MGKFIEISIYVMFGLLLVYKLKNDYISERLENVFKFSLYTLIIIYLILADMSSNIIFIVFIGTVLFVPSMINMGYDGEEEDLTHAVEILLATVNIFIILIKFGVMRILFNI